MEITKLLSSSRDRLTKKLKDFSYRHSWVESHVTNGIAFQLRAMRKARQWEQEKLAEVALGSPKLQPMISRYENPDYGKYSLRTLLDFARAFDVALQVRFAPFSEIIKWEDDLPGIELSVPTFEAELANGSLNEGRSTTMANTAAPVAISTTGYGYGFLRPKVVNLPGVSANPFVRASVPPPEAHHQIGESTHVN